MGSRAQPNKFLLDIEDCVSELKRQSEDGKVPINDDSTALHRLQEKLELILLFGLIEKPGLLGPKKSYWNYICACFATTKRSHDGINFVKSVIALKTPLGRGRAFIRFCLTQKCLADTLQSCFMNQKVSRDFYTERSLPLQEKLWSTLVTILYELNDLNFDLCAGHTELDISWPKFAWKLFTVPDNENFPHRNMSTPNLYTYASQGEFNGVKHSADSTVINICSSSSDNCSVISDAVKLAELNAKLSQENEDLKKEVGCLGEEKIKLLSNIEVLQNECLSLKQQLNNSSKEQCKIASNQAQLKMENGLDDFSSTPSKDISISENTKAEKIADKLMNEEEIPLSSASSPSVKLKIHNTVSQNFPDCALSDKDSKMPSDHALNPHMVSKDSENSQINRNIAQNPVYINELLIEIKTVIDDIEDTIQKSDVTLAIPHISRLKKIRNHLEDIFSSDVHKSKNYLNFSNFVESCVTCIKNIASKQEIIINSLQEKVDLSIKGNHNLYSRIKTLKDLLKSYGFLRVTNEREIEPDNVLLPDSCSAVSKFSCEDFACDIAHDPMLKRIIVPLLPVLNSTYSKLNSLNEKMVELQFGLDTSQGLNNLLITRVQDQEMHLKGVTKEIEEAQQLVSVLKKQHRKLQSAEGIVKYDLQEKRKLLTRLKQQLENTREDFNLVRIKNSKSEAEWQDLHKEFAQRHKQTSVESGFVDDKAFEEQETVSSSTSCDSNYPEESTSEKDSINKDITETPQITKKARLALLEEQCQNLYSSLLNSSKRRQEIDKRLETMCRTIEKNNEHIHSNTLASSDLSAESTISNVNDAVNQTENNCQSIFSSEAFTNSPPTSDVGSLNSECSSCIIPGICHDINSSDNSYCDSSKADSCISCSPYKLHNGAMQPLSAAEEIKECNFLHNSSACTSEYQESDEFFSSCASSDLTINNSELPSISHVDSILTKKKDLEESLKILEIDSGVQSEENMRFSHSEEFNEQFFILQNDKKQLLSRIQELEKRILILTTELDQTTQQLVLSKAAKEHEIAALQFQLNTEALKYERALKEFSEQSKGLESMKQRVTEQEKLILALEEALTEIHSDRENEKELRWQELEDIHIALEAREQECITLSQELEKSMSEVEEEHSRNEILLSQLEELKLYNRKDKENMEAEILSLKHYSRELQKKLVKLLKEKDILWKRNDHLYHLQKVKIDDRWINDSEVSSCLACKNSFSFILRKHHCRVCGRIFCYSCSNNWLTTASSRKKIRACNECFLQHMEIKKVVRRGSDVPHIDDESEDEMDKDNCDLSFLHASRSSFISEIPSSMSNSIISLPVTQKCNTSRFASAPDLRYVYKPNEFASCSVSLAEDKLESEEEKLQVFNGHANEDLEKEADNILNEFIPAQLDETVPVKLDETLPVQLDETLPVQLDETLPVLLADTDPTKLDETLPVQLDESLQLDETIQLDDTPPVQLDETIQLDDTPPVQLDETLPVQLDETLPVQLDETLPVQLDETILLDDTPPVQLDETLPVQLDETLPVQLDETILLDDTPPVQLDETLPVQLDETLPVQLDDTLPVQLDETLQLDKTIQLDDTPPVQLDETLPVQLDETLPVQLEDTLPVQLDETLPVQLDETLPVQLDETLPVQLDKTLQLDETLPVQLDETVPKICTPGKISLDDLINFDCSLNGKLVVLPGKSIDLPVFCQTCPVILKWTFISDYQTIPFTISYDGENSCDNKSTIFYQTSEKMQDQVKLTSSGYYIFHFDNTIRNTGIEIQYVLTAVKGS